jgi:hypothetical protein
MAVLTIGAIALLLVPGFAYWQTRQRVAAALADVTERKRAEAALIEERPMPRSAAWRGNPARNS